MKAAKAILSAIVIAGGVSVAGAVEICHVPPGNPNKAHSIDIGASAVDAHLLNHAGDHMGACGSLTASVIAPDQVRSIQTNEGPFPLVYVPGPVDPACPASLAGAKFDLVSEIIGDYTPAAGGANTNTAGEGLLGYFDFGPLVGTLNCTTTIPPKTALTLTVVPLLDGQAIFRFSLAGLDPGNVQAAALHITPAPAQSGFWTTYGVTACIPSEVYDLTGLDFEPAVTPDCIYDERDFVGFVSFLQIHDVGSSANLRNPTVGHLGGRSDIGFFENLLNFAGITIPLNEKAIDIIKSGGNPAGYLEVIVKMADPKGAFSEGPGGFATFLGLVGVNTNIIEDRGGFFAGTPALAASTDLVVLSKP